MALLPAIRTILKNIGLLSLTVLTTTSLANTVNTIQYSIITTTTSASSITQILTKPLIIVQIILLTLSLYYLTDEIYSKSLNTIEKTDKEDIVNKLPNTGVELS